MKNFKELCEAHLEFEEIVERKCKEYCIIHLYTNPFTEYNLAIYINDDNITIGYDVSDRCGGMNMNL